MEYKYQKALIVGGGSGIGLSVAMNIAGLCKEVNIVDRGIKLDNVPSNIVFHKVNLLNKDYSFLDSLGDIDFLFISAGFGRVAPFETYVKQEITNIFQVNAISAITILNHYMPRLLSDNNLDCGIMTSIAGLVSSPLFAVYAATKAALCRAIESINVELEMGGSRNRILDVAPGSIQGTAFNGGPNDPSKTNELALSIINEMQSKSMRYIPQYDSVFKGVIDRYVKDSHRFGVDSYVYKKEAGRLNEKPQVKVGYLSGTFDLFHVGHLNLIKRAKEYCDYLVVGVNKDGKRKGKDTFISLEDRMTILRGCKYVDKVIVAEEEDSDVYLKGICKYDFLFVGSDYKGSERFENYERIFRDSNVKIVYFPYTKGVSSTHIRNRIDSN